MITKMKKRTGIVFFYGFNPLRFIHTFYTNVYDFSYYLAKELFKSFIALKDSWHPWFEKIKNTIKGIISFIWTLKTSFQLMPVVLSALTILSAAPLIHHILPTFLLEPFVIIPTLLTISAYAGYTTYKDLITRAKLDKQIEENQRINEGLLTRIKDLEKRLNRTSKRKNNAMSKTDSANDMHYFLRSHYSKPTSTPSKKRSYSARKKIRLL